MPTGNYGELRLHATAPRPEQPVSEVRDDAGVIREDSHAFADPERLAFGHFDDAVLLAHPGDATLAAEDEAVAAGPRAEPVAREDLAARVQHGASRSGHADDRGEH